MYTIRNQTDGQQFKVLVDREIVCDSEVFNAFVIKKF